MYDGSRNGIFLISSTVYCRDAGYMQPLLQLHMGKWLQDIKERGANDMKDWRAMKRRTYSPVLRKQAALYIPAHNDHRWITHNKPANAVFAISVTSAWTVSSV